MEEPTGVPPEELDLGLSVPVDLATFARQALARNINEALAQSEWTCARCKSCDTQVDAVMAVVWPLLVEARQEAEVLQRNWHGDREKIVAVRTWAGKLRQVPHHAASVLASELSDILATDYRPAEDAR